MMNSRAAAVFAPLVQPGQKLCMVIWDSWPLQIQKPGNHKDMRATWSTKIHGSSLSRMEGCDDKNGILEKLKLRKMKRHGKIS